MDRKSSKKWIKIIFYKNDKKKLDLGRKIIKSFFRLNRALSSGRNAVAFQATEEGSIPFARSIFKFSEFHWI